jgi:hypothetical protein
MSIINELGKLEDFAKFIENRWQTISGLFVVELFTFILVFKFTWDNLNYLTSIFITAFTLSAILIFWLWSIKLPKTKKNKVGFLVAISFSDLKEKKKIQEDFITPLHQLIKSGNNANTFDFLIANQYQSQKIITLDDAEKLRLKAKARFMIYGHVKLRNINNIETHIIELEGIVSHNKVDDERATKFSKEFAELLPRRLHASTQNDVLALQLTSQWLDIVAKYIIATAAALSNDLNYSEKLYTEIKIKLPTIEDRIPVYSLLKQRIAEKLSEIKLIKAQRLFDEWTKDKENLLPIISSDNFLQDLIQGHQSSVEVQTLKALCCFLLKRDIANTLLHLNSINKEKRDQIWHLNMAFIYAYSGNLNNAARSYRLAAQEGSFPTILGQVEDFIVWMINKEPKKIELHYALGYFNWKLKGDNKMAKEDFQYFVRDNTAKINYPNEFKVATKFINEN